MIKTTALKRLIKTSGLLALSLSLDLSGKANTADNVNNGSSDLTAAATYAGGLPTTSNDVVFTAVPYSPSAFTLNTPGYNLSVGTLNDLSTTALTIQNATAGSYSTITLNGGTNNAPGGSASNDILYVASGANLTVGGGSGGTLFLNVVGNGSLDIAGSATIAGPLTGTGTLSKTGTGTLDLAGGSLSTLISATTTASIYTGGLTISAGAVALSNTNALEGASVTNSVTNGLTFDSAVTSHTFDVGALSGASNLALTDTGSNAVTLVLTENSFGLGTAATAGSYSGALSGGGSLVKEGSNTQTLSGTNTYSGSTTVNGGTLTITGSLSSTSLALGGGTFTYNKTSGTKTFTTTTLNAGSSSVTTASGETINLGTVTRNADSGLDFGSAGTIDASGLSNTNGIIGGWATQGGQTTFAVAPATAGGAVTGLATASYLSSATAGTTASNYSNANIDMTANETIASGTITPNAIRFASSTGYTLTLNTGTNTIEAGGILDTSATGSTNVITGGTITSGTSELDVTVVKTVSLGSIVADNGAAVAVVLNGGGTLNLNATNNTYTGGTFVNNGILATGAAGAFGSGTITLGANGSSANAYLVGGSATYSNAITVNPGGNRQFYTSSGGAPTYSGLITLVGGADLAVGSNGGGAITIKGGVTGTGNLQIGSPEGTNRSQNTNISTGAVNITGTLSDFSGVDTTAAVNVSAAVTGNTAILQDGTNQLFVFTGTNTNTGATTISSGYLQVGGTATGGATPTIGAASANGSLSPNSDIVDNGTLVIDRTGTVTQGTNFSTAGITGTGALTLYGTGTTILTAANTYTGGTSILTNAANPTAGKLQLGNGGTTGSLSVSSVITDNGTFVIDRSNTVTEGTDFTTAANFTGTGGLSQIGTGTTILLGANAYSGVTLISAGTLQLGNGTTNGSLTSTSSISDNGTLTFDESASIAQSAVVPGIITGTGAVVQEGTGTLTMSGANTFSGGLTIDSAVSVASVGAASAAQPLGEGLITLAGTSSGAGILNYSGNTGTLGNAITVTTGDQGSIVNNGNGLLTLGGAISKNGSVLNLMDGPSGAGAFNVTGHITGSSSGSDLNVINTDVTLSNTNTYNGPTTISGDSADTVSYDVLTTAIAGALPSTSVVNLGSTANEGSGGYNNYLDLDGTAQTIGGLSSVNDSTDTNYVINSTGGPSYGTANGTDAALTIAPAAGTTYTFGGTLGGVAGAGSPNNISVTVSGPGTQIFTGANTYTKGTTINGGALYVNNTTGSGTGTGAVQVNSGGTLGGSGTISGPVTVNTTPVVSPTTPTPAVLASGSDQTANAFMNGGTGTVSGPGLTLSSTLSVNGGSSLTFALGSNINSNGGYNILTPNMDSTFLTVNGTGTIFSNTTTADNILLTDLTYTAPLATPTDPSTLTLRYQGAYLLIAGNAADFANLYTTGAGNTGNGYVLGVDNGSGGYTAFNIEMLSPSGGVINSSSNYENLQLYLNGGNLEVVPEPSTWAMMLGGLAVLVLWQRRRSSRS